MERKKPNGLNRKPRSDRVPAFRRDLPNWPSRSALLLDACSKIGTRPEIPDTGSLKGDVSALAYHLAQQLTSARWAAVLPSIIDAAERDPEVPLLHTNLHAGFMVPFLAVAERGEKKGRVGSRAESLRFRGRCCLAVLLPALVLPGTPRRKIREKRR